MHLTTFIIPALILLLTSSVGYYTDTGRWAPRLKQPQRPSARLPRVARPGRHRCTCRGRLMAGCPRHDRAGYIRKHVKSGMVWDVEARRWLLREPPDPLDALRDAYLADPDADTVAYLLAVDRLGRSHPYGTTPDGLTDEVRVQREAEYREFGLPMPPATERMADARAEALRRWPEHFTSTERPRADPLTLSNRKSHGNPCSCPPEALERVTDGTGHWYTFCDGSCRRQRRPNPLDRLPPRS